jgi:hypothetical protein
MDISDLLHLTIPCPACSKPAHVVASFSDERSHWCCVSCQVIGVMPLHIEREPTLPPSFPPVASA